MNKSKLILSIALGFVLTIGLLVGFSLSRSPAMASMEVTEVIDQTSPGEPTGAQDTVSTAYIVVRFADKETIVREITFTQPITSYRALELAGLNPVGYIDPTYGQMLCGIDGVGQVSPDGTSCDNGSYYWGTYDWDGASWALDMGVGTLISHDDHVDGYSWGSYPPGTPAPALPARPYVGALGALEWLRPRQDVDTGAYGGIGGTVETVLSVAANGWDAGAWRQQAGNPSLLHHLYGNSGPYVVNAGRAGKLATSLAATGGCWPIDTMKPTDYYSPTTGQYAPEAINQAWAMFGVKALSQTVPAAAREALKDMITENGGWGWPGFGEDTDTTAMAIQALVAAGEPVTSTHIVSGLTYLKAHQNSDGGFNAGWSTNTSNASTARAIQAILSVGQDPLTGTWAVSSTNPVNYLVNAQGEDGSFVYGVEPNEVETRQAAVAMLGRTFPLKIAEVPTCYGISGWAKGVGDSAVPNVTVTAEGWNNSGIESESGATGHYTISVPSAGTYKLTPLKGGFTFTPTSQSVEVSGAPGDITLAPDFAGETRIYLPLIMRY